MSMNRGGKPTGVAKPISGKRSVSSESGNSRFENMVAMPIRRRKSKLFAFLKVFK